MNAIPVAVTRDYRTADGTKFAKVAEAAIGLFGEPVYSRTLNATVRLYSYKSTGRLACKEFSVAFNLNNVKIIDQTYGNPGPELVATIDNGQASLYVSGYEDLSRVQVQLLQCNDPQFMHFSSYSRFEYDLSGSTVYSSSNGLTEYVTYTPTYRNGWVDDGGKTRMYSKGSMVYVDFSITGGALPSGSSGVPPFYLPVPTTESKDFPVMFKVGTEFKTARLRIWGDGAVSVYGVTDNEQVAGSFFYRMRA